MIDLESFAKGLTYLGCSLGPDDHHLTVALPEKAYWELWYAVSKRSIELSELSGNGGILVQPQPPVATSMTDSAGHRSTSSCSGQSAALGQNHGHELDPV